MRLLILGATGPCGQLLIGEALDHEHTVVVYARSPQKLPDSITHDPRVIIHKGELEDDDALDKAMDGVHAVISALGPATTRGPLHPSGTPLAKGYERVIAAMKKHNIKRLIALGTASIKDPHDHFSLLFAGLITGVAVLAHTAYKDIVAIGEVIRGHGDDLLWTIVRVPLLNDNKTREVVVGYIGDGKVGIHLTRVGFAAFVLGEVESNEWINKAPLISSP